MEKIQNPKYEFTTFLATPLPNDSDSSFLSLPSSSSSSTGSGSLPPPRSMGSASRKRQREQSSSLAGSTRQPLPNTANASRNSATTTSSSSSSTRCTPAGSHSSHSHTPSSRTPSSSAVTSATPATPQQSAIIVAIVEGRGHARGEIGMASIDLKSPELHLSQFPDSQTYVKVMTKLEVLRPLEVIMPNTVCEGVTVTKLFKMVTNHCPQANLATVQRKYFNEGKGLQYVRQLVVPEYNTVELEVASKYYCLAAAAALLKYVEFIQNIVYAPSSLKVVFRGSEQTVMIDISTVKNLELISNMSDHKSPHSLFGVLNHTKTPQGGRLLRSNILQPPCNLETITLRQECIQELTDNEEMFYSLQSVLKRFVDVDHVVSLLVQLPKQETVRTAENKITMVISLKHVLELVEPLKTAIGGSKNLLMAAFHTMLGDPRFQSMLEKIGHVIHDDSHYQKGTLNMRAQKCFAVKPNLNGYLDVARRTYSETIDDIAELVEQVGEQHGLSLRTSFNNSRGFFIQIYTGPGADDKCRELTPDQLPAAFIKVTKNRNTISCTVADLIKMNDRCRESLNEIYLMTNVVISDLLTELRSTVGCLYKLSECVAMLDMLLSLAHSCTVSNYVRPEFTDTLAIKEGRHPILEKIAFEQTVPNSTYASPESNFIIVTGPNMSGKSTYLKQVALLQIMAQLGCFVSAQYASFRLTHQVFSRIGSDDDIETNASTFMMEMRGINYIIQNVGDDSLIIVDELGRGTSSEEGVGLCHAICEHLLSTKAYTFFATHYLELTQLETLYPNVENCHFVVKMVSGSGDEEKRGISYTHQLTKGKTKEKHYGLQLAAMSTLPASIVRHAEEISAQIQEQRKAGQQQSSESIQMRAVYKLGCRLVQVARNSQLDENGLRMYLKHLRTQYLSEITPDTDKQTIEE